jgi:hypothetical protein
VRRIYGRSRLGSKTYTKIMRWNSRVGVTKKLERMLGLHSESVIQDVDIPLSRAAEFLDFYAKQIQLWPQWICPIGVKQRPLRALPGEARLVRELRLLGREAHARGVPAGLLQPLIEEKVHELGGIKSLYSDSYFPERQFNQRYGGAAYDALKKKYDPSGAFPRLYDKCVLKA